MCVHSSLFGHVGLRRLTELNSSPFLIRNHGGIPFDPLGFLPLKWYSQNDVNAVGLKQISLKCQYLKIPRPETENSQ